MEITQRTIETIPFATTIACCMQGSAWIIPQQPQNKSVGRVLFLFPFYSGESKAQTGQVIYNQKRAESVLTDSTLFKHTLIESTMYQTHTYQPTLKTKLAWHQSPAFNSCAESSRISLLYLLEGVEKERHTWGHYKLQGHILSPLEMMGSSSGFWSDYQGPYVTWNKITMYHHEITTDLNH